MSTATHVTADELLEKIEEWLAAGCSAVWVVDPKLQTVMCYRSTRNVVVKTAGQLLQGDPIVPGFSCVVDEFFA